MPSARAARSRRSARCGRTRAVTCRWCPAGGPDTRRARCRRSGAPPSSLPSAGSRRPSPHPVELLLVRRGISGRGALRGLTVTADPEVDARTLLLDRLLGTCERDRCAIAAVGHCDGGPGRRGRDEQCEAAGQDGDQLHARSSRARRFTVGGGNDGERWVSRLSVATLPPPQPQLASRTQ